MERDSNKILTAVVCLGAAVVSVAYFLSARSKQRRPGNVSKTHDLGESAKKNGDGQQAVYDHLFYQTVANASVIQIRTQREWHDSTLGVKFQFSPQCLKLVLEERHYPLIHVKFIVVSDHQASVSVVIEECNDVATLDDYRESCIARLEHCAKILPIEAFKFGSLQLRTLSYQYTNEVDVVVTVLAVLQKDGSRCVTVQHQTLGEKCAGGCRSIVGDLVRSVKFAAPGPSSSFLFCTEPRHGVGLRLPLNLTLMNEGLTTDADLIASPQASLPFAALLGEYGQLSVVARYERYAPAKNAAREVIGKLLHQAKTRYSLRKKLVSADAGHQKMSDELQVTVMSSRVTGNNDDEGVQRANECVFFVVECPVDSFGHDHIEGLVPMAGGSTGALLCVYLYNVLSEYVSVSFFALKSPTISLETFLPICTGIADSLTIGNHYGQETTLLYCNRRFCFPFDIRLGSQWKCWEPPLGDPLCIVGVLGLSWQDVEVRAIPCPVDVMEGGGVEKFQRECWHRVQQLHPHKTTIHSSDLRPARRGFVSFDIVFCAVEENENPGDDDDFTALAEFDSETSSALGNPFARCQCTRPRDSDPATPRADESLRIAVLLCCNDGFAFLLQIATSKYHQEESRRVIEEVASNLSMTRV